MKAIIVGAGRGSRLRHLTEEIPKTLVPILGRPMLDSILEALAAGGLTPPDVVFICGYRADVIRARYPHLHYVENRSWKLDLATIARTALSAVRGDGVK